MSHQGNPKFLDESSTQHLAWEIYADESSKAFFFLEYMSAVFTSPKSPVIDKYHWSKKEHTGGFGYAGSRNGDVGKVDSWPGQISLLNTPYRGCACDVFSAKIIEDGGTLLKVGNPASFSL